MIDFSFFRHALGSAGAGLRRHAGDHAMGMLVGGGAALTVIAAGIAFAAFGGHGGGAGGGGGSSGGGGASGASNTSTHTRVATAQIGDDIIGPQRRAAHMPLTTEPDSVGLLQGRAPLHIPEPAAQEPFVALGSDQGRDQRGVNFAHDSSFESGARPMLAMAGNTNRSAIGLGIGGGYGVRAKALQEPTTSSPVPEPETYALMLAGLGLLGWQARRRKAAANQAN
jgi:hypothetical protein